MKKEILIAIIFITLVTLGVIGVPFTKLILIFSIVPISILLILDYKSNPLLGKQNWVVIFSIYYKIVLYTTSIFIVLDYPGKDLLSIFSIAVLVLFIGLVSILGISKKPMNTALVYMQVSMILFLLLR